MSVGYAPGPKGNALLGSLGPFQKDQLAFFSSLFHTYGDVSHFRLGPAHIHLICHPDLIREVLIDKAREYQKAAHSNGLFRRFLGDSMLTLEGEAQRKQRKFSGPAFHHKRLAQYGEAMADCALQRISTWVDGKELDAVEEMQTLTASVVTRTLVGVEDASRTNEIAGQVDEINQAFAGLLSAVPWPEWVPTKLNRRMRRATAEVDRLLTELISDRLKTQEDKGDLLSMLVQVREDDQPLTPTQLLSELKTFYIAGFETSARALAWLCMLLTQHPEVQQKLREEVATVIGDRMPGFEDLKKLPYVEKVIKEGMRLYPPAWGYTRSPANGDVTLGGHTVKKGDTIFISPWVTHRDARYYPNPEAFLPERWTPEFTASLPKTAYIPFSAGPRICIGWEFAMMEMVLIVATIAPRIELLPGVTPSPQPVGRITLTFKGKVGFRPKLLKPAAPRMANAN